MKKYGALEMTEEVLLTKVILPILKGLKVKAAKQ